MGPKRGVPPGRSWPVVVWPAMVHLVDKCWEELSPVLHECILCTLLRGEVLVRHPKSSEPILNGLFSGYKGAVTVSCYFEVFANLRLIIGAVLASSIQERLFVYIADLPLPMLWNRRRC